MNGRSSVKVVVTGSRGLLGWHAAARLHARNCSARFRREEEPFSVVMLDRTTFSNRDRLVEGLSEADAVLHFAGVNRASPDEMEKANPVIAEQLIQGCRDAGATPHIIYANSTHAESDSTYGRSKRRAAEILGAFASRFTDVVLPHIFGECARPHYNNVTATFIDQVIRNESPSVDPNGSVQLLHAGEAAELFIEAALQGTLGTIRPSSRGMRVTELFDRVARLDRDYRQNVYPDLSDAFELALFNSYRAALYPGGFPLRLAVKRDSRGTLFEAVKGGGGGQTFLSWTEPGATRGDHFHLNKVERFLVLEGTAVIRIRRVLNGPIWTYQVNGDAVAALDMPTLHTHSIENIGSRPLLTMFWANEIFDPAAPDTFADSVMGG